VENGEDLARVEEEEEEEESEKGCNPNSIT